MPLYNPVIYDRSLPAQSYWETTAQPPECSALQQSETCEVAIIGAGLTGLSAALHLAQAGVQVAILEAGHPGWGASGRNGGFCCVGATALEPERLLHRFGTAAVRQFYQQQREAVELVKALAAAESLDLEAQGNGEIQVAHHASYLADLAAEFSFYKNIADYPCQLWSQSELVEHGFASPEAVGALHLDVGFGLNPLKYSCGLAEAVIRRGVKLYAHSPLETWEQQNGWHELHSPGGCLKAKTVIVATNGYTEDRLHPQLSGCLLPVISQIITTRPLTSAELAAQNWQTETPVFSTHQPLFYYRLLKDGRFLFGSRGDTDGSLSERQRRQDWMQRRLGELFPAWQQIEITHGWNGLVAISANLTPQIGQLDAQSFYGLAYHGSGVGTATWVGQALAHWILGKLDPAEISPVFRQPLKSFPIAPWRVWLLRGMCGLFAAQNWLKCRERSAAQ
ncbi:MAG: FAD-binding oxidoreductase [Pegethrix bostrychoides GSE-TBD4-15B]|jgi:glycine/D-amino acid oxidase-like deaminating enzyme|uniref:FAD-binding oxidoreductase n=1 Tax=Pegethrix bostrychoides GSE-TBD4-15B TaxID=2839662 RepID=A0A951P801_9CYAN|nr:FAD-binding oxidoreductase [Pegethrix bostrychoides GSE-TBD4-15B]